MTSAFQLEGEQQGDRGQVGVGLGLCLANKEAQSKVSVITEMGREGQADEELRGRLKNKHRGKWEGEVGQTGRGWKWLTQAGFTEFS